MITTEAKRLQSESKTGLQILPGVAVMLSAVCWHSVQNRNHADDASAGICFNPEVGSRHIW